MKRAIIAYSLVAFVAALFVISGCGSDEQSSPNSADYDYQYDYEQPDSQGETQEYSATIVASPNALDFGEVAIGDIKCLNVELSNTGSYAISLRSLVITGDGASKFAAQNFSPGNLLAGDSKTIEFCYTPDEETLDEATAEIENTSDNAPNLAISLLGVGVVPQEKRLAVLGLEENNTVEFGEVAIGSIGAMKTLNLRNNGSNSVLTISGVYLDVYDCTTPEAFELQFNDRTEITQDNPVQLRAGEGYFSFGIIYRPVAEGEDTCKLYIDTDSDIEEEQHFAITLHGRGVSAGLTVSPMPIDFGAVTVGTSQTIDVILTNISEQTVHISYAQLADFSRDEYTLDDHGNSNIDLPPSGSAQYSITFTPMSEGENNGHLKVISDLEGAQIMYFPVFGRGTRGNQPPVARVSLTSHGAPIDEVLHFDLGHTQEFFGDTSYDPDSTIPISVFRWRWWDKPETSTATFQPDDHSVSVSITFDAVGEYRFSLEVQDSEGAWSAPFYVRVSIAKREDIRIEMTFADGCEGEQNVSLAWAPPGLAFCSQEELSTGQPPQCNFPPGEGYGSAVFERVSNGCADGATEILHHTNIEKDGNYRLRVKLLEDCTWRLNQYCMDRSGINVTVKIYINDESTPRWTLTTYLANKGDYHVWQVPRVNGAFQNPTDMQ